MYRFQHVVQSVDVAFGEKPTVGADGNAAPGPDMAVGDEGPALALLAESEVLELADDQEGESVVQRSEVDVADFDPGASVQAGRNVRGKEGREVVALVRC